MAKNSRHLVLQPFHKANGRRNLRQRQACGERVSGVDGDIAVLAEEGVVGVAEPSARRRRQPSQARTISAPTALPGAKRALAGDVAGAEEAEVVYVRRKPESHHASCGSQRFAISDVSNLIVVGLRGSLGPTVGFISNGIGRRPRSPSIRFPGMPLIRWAGRHAVAHQRLENRDKATVAVAVPLSAETGTQFLDATRPRLTSPP
ncbi:hypothetical protein C4D60_Mb07t18950 [Musa balbisiana]|uniref:Uncharacterized protein n=1 Tax=Musa balbisiana TaxID=52838 RepID=A0A4S8JGD2_MUSBA|nr:hypothetical protein C4D60_Mb07t18950 [Musa balbisiana]